MTSQENRKKYLKAPTLEQLEEFLIELGVTGPQFERFYGVPNGTMRQVRRGVREFPAKFWHIIYEKIKPAYGSGYLGPQGVILDKKPTVTKPETNSKNKAQLTINPEADSSPVQAEKNPSLIHDRLRLLKGEN